MQCLDYYVCLKKSHKYVLKFVVEVLASLVHLTSHIIVCFFMINIKLFVRSTQSNRLLKDCHITSFELVYMRLSFTFEGSRRMQQEHNATV